MNLNQVTLPALNIAESTAFYLNMGFIQVVEAPHYARFACPSGDSTFSIHRVDHLLPSPDVIIYFETESLDAKVADLKAQGYRFDQEPRDEPWLWREARLKDPSGNVICLYFAGENRKNPPWRVSG